MLACIGQCWIIFGHRGSAMLALLHDLGFTFPLRRRGLGKDIFIITILAQTSARKQDHVRKWRHSTIYVVVSCNPMYHVLYEQFIKRELFEN